MLGVEACFSSALVGWLRFEGRRLWSLAAACGLAAVSALAIFAILCVALANEGWEFSYVKTFPCADEFLSSDTPLHSSGSFLKEGFAPDLEIVPSIEESFSP